MQSDVRIGLAENEPRRYGVSLGVPRIYLWNRVLNPIALSGPFVYTRLYWLVKTEAHLAKVAWFCVTQLELERLEKEKAK